MSAKHITIPCVILGVLAAGGYYWLAAAKQMAVEAAVRLWQEDAIDYLSFDYKAVNTHLWDDTITLEQVQVTFPVLMSVDEVKVSSKVANNITAALHLTAIGANFTVPGLTADEPWRGDVDIDYVYAPDLKQIDLSFAPRFPGLLVGSVETTFVDINPTVDIIFNYTDILLLKLQLELQNEGLIKNADVLAWANTLNNPQQRDAFVNFLQNEQMLYINFLPEYPISVHHVLENPKIFWQHPATEVDS